MLNQYFLNKVLDYAETVGRIKGVIKLVNFGVMDYEDALEHIAQIIEKNDKRREEQDNAELCGTAGTDKNAVK